MTLEEIYLEQLAKRQAALGDEKSLQLLQQKREEEKAFWRKQMEQINRLRGIPSPMPPTMTGARG